MAPDSPAAAATIRSLSAPELMAMDLPQPRLLLEARLASGADARPAPLLTSKSLALLHGPRGIGKTFAALGIARAVATGGRFLGWQAPAPRRVLYIDGEMAAAELGARLRLVGPGTQPLPETLTFLLGDLHRETEGLPDLGSFEGHKALLKHWNGALPDLLVLDNLSSLLVPRYVPGAGGADHWRAFQRFLLYLRRRGTAVLAVDHDDRKGQRRNAARREELMDLVLALRPTKERPSHEPRREGAHFEIHFEKARHLWGDAITPIEARLAPDPTCGGAGGRQWEWQFAPHGEFDRFAALLREGLNPNQIARTLGISKSKSYRLRERVTAIGNSAPST